MSVITETTLLQRARDIHFDGTDAKANRINNQCINNALRMLTTMANWSFLEKWHRVVTWAGYSTGEVTMTQGNLTCFLEADPTADWTTSWGGSSKLHVIEINGNPPAMEIVSVIGSVATSIYTAAAIMRSDHTWHGANASGSSYAIYKERYALPANTRSIAGAFHEENYPLDYIDEDEWRNLKARSSTASRPLYYTFIRNNDVDREEIGFWPYPNDEYAVDVFVRKWPATLTAGGGADTEFPVFMEPLVFKLLEWAIYDYRRQFTDAERLLNQARLMLPQFKGSMSKYTGIRRMGGVRAYKLFAPGKGDDVE